MDLISQFCATLAFCFILLFPISNSPQIPIQDCDAEDRKGEKGWKSPYILNSPFWKGISANANSVPQKPPHKTKPYGNGRGHPLLLKWWRYSLWIQSYINPSSLLKAIISFLASICLIIFCVTWHLRRFCHCLLARASRLAEVEKYPASLVQLVSNLFRSLLKLAQFQDW